MANQLSKNLTGQDAGQGGVPDHKGFADVEKNWGKKYQTLYAHETKFYQLRDALSEKYHIKEMQDALRSSKLTAEEKLKLEKDLIKALSEIERRSVEGTAKYREMVYKRGSVEMKTNMLKNEAELLEQKKKNLEQQYAIEYSLNTGSHQSRSAMTRKYWAEQRKLALEQADLRKQQYELEKSQEMKSIQRMKRNTAELKERGGNIVDIGLQLSKDIGKIDMKAIAKEAEERLAKAEAELENLEVDFDAEMDRLNQFNASEEKKEEARREYQKRYEEMQRAKNQAATEKLITEAVSKLQDTYDKAFKEAESMLTDYKGHIDARLQGSDSSYNDIMGKISTNLSLSPFVKTQDVMKKMRDAVDNGIAYNVEQRAFLSSIADKIANTFDAFDGNLTRLIKLQQADTTAARLGMEASLTKFFNNMFQDTSYLGTASGSGIYDQVSAAIIDANASLNRNQSAEFEYMVQKWLGSLSSVGMSDSTITNIATGINYLATGDVTSLANNTQLQTLFAMSAARAGLEYSDLLLNGLNASNTNKLLQSMVEYLKDIAENSDSQVVRSAYGDIFNLSLSDMKAISNLRSGDISNIASNTMSYSAMNTELNKQMLMLVTRTSISEMMSNLLNNAVFGVAEDMVSNPATYAMTKMLDFLEYSKLDMNIPFVNAMGFGLDLNTSVQDIMRLGVGLSQALSLMTNILGGLGSAGGLNLNAWGGTEYTQRGSGMSFSTGSTLGATSGSTYVSTSSSQDMKNSSLSSATDEAEETSKITNKNSKVEHTFDDFYEATIGEKASSYIKVQDVLLLEVFNNEQNYLGTRDMRMVFHEDSLKVFDLYSYDQFGRVFGDVSVVEEGKVKIAPPDKTFRIKPEDATLPVHIASVADSVKASTNIVTLSPNSTVSIDETTLVNAFKKAMGYDKKTKDIKNMNDLIELIENGDLVFPITNRPGLKLQVDTEFSGTSGYVAKNTIW